VASGKGTGMAESGGISRILGNQSESAAEGSIAESQTPLDPTAASLAAEVARNDPELAQAASAYFRKQSHLVEIQTEHLHEQRIVNLQLLKLKRLGERLRVGLQVFVILAATAIGLSIVVMVRDAVTSRRVVIEPFHTPPGLAARGIDGTVIASGLLDQLSQLQDATRSSSAARGLTGAWTSTIKLDVPEAGISVGEISRLLKERFGHDVQIDGDLVETPTGELQLTVRGNGVPPRTFGAGGADLAKLTVAAAEYVYSMSQPVRWATFLNNSGRYAEAITFCRTAIPSVAPEDRSMLLTRWALANDSSGGSTRESLELLRAAIKLQPNDWIARANISNDLMIVNDEEGSWRAGEDMRAAAGGRPGKAPEIYYQNWDYLTWNLPAWLEETRADAEANAGMGTGQSSAGPTLGDIFARMHDSEAAELALKTTKEAVGDLTIGAMTHFVRGRLAAEAGDVRVAASEMEAFGIAYANPAESTNNPGYNCWIASAEEDAGRPDKADEVLRTGGAFVDCYRFRADILSGRGNWSGAQKAYAEAVALAPDLPAAYYSWGLALATHGDLAGAEAKLADANKRGPQWADPLKAWGDLLAKQGKTKDALAKYDQALKYAPNWKQLKQVREALVKQKS
jgi:tetratricopeptide (TPR) repeat protein